MILDASPTVAWASSFAHHYPGRWRRGMLPGKWARVRPVEEVVIGGRRAWAGLVSALLLAAGLVGGGPAGAEPPSASDRSDPVAGSVERTGRVWRNVSGGFSHTCGVRTDQSLWCWGFNFHGQLGLGDRSHRRMPTRVGTDANWALVTPGGDHTCGVRTNRSLWCWGRNADGQLGLGDLTNRRLPKRV